MLVFNIFIIVLIVCCALLVLAALAIAVATCFISQSISAFEEQRELDAYCKEHDEKYD